MSRLVSILAVAACLAQNPEALMRSGRFAEAAAEYEAILKRSPKAAEALFSLGVCYSQLGRPADAVRMLQRHIAVEPRSAAGHSVLGLLLLEAGELEEARRELEVAHRLDPAEPETAKGLARACWAGNAPARAIAVLKAIPDPDDEARLLLAETLLETGDAAGAAALAVSLARPDASESAAALACRAQLAAGRLAEAVRICEGGLRAHPDSDRLAALYVSLPHDLLALRLRDRASIAMRSSDLPELLSLAFVLMGIDPERKTKALDTAAGLLDQAARIAPRDSVVAYATGRLLRARGRPEAEVFAAYEEALAARPPAPLRIRIWLEIGRREQLRSNPPGAERAFAAAAEENRRSPSPRAEPPFAFYRFLRDRARHEEAARLLGEALRFEPFHAPARLERAKAAAAAERWAEAAREAELALPRAGGDAELLRSAHVLLARCYHALGRNEQARAHQAWIEAH